MTTPVIGLIGLGLMGSAASRRLSDLGYTLVGLDIDPDRLNAAAAWGVQAARTPAEVGERADIVLTSLTRTQDLAQIVEGEHGLLSSAKLAGKTLCDLSTTEIEETLRLAGRLEQVAGMAFADAPVSGGPPAASSGSLAIMVGARAETFAKVEGLLGQLGKATHMGGVGAGQATKLVNQALVLTNYCVIAEAVRLAEAYGIDARRVPEALGQGHAGSNLLPVLFERMIERDFAPRGYARQVLKDLEMLNDAAHTRGLALPMAGQALTLYRLLVAGGKSELDGASIVTLWPEPAQKPPHAG